MNAPITFRRIKRTDRPFLYRVFVSTRPDITMLNTSDEEKRKLLESQFNAQDYHYHTYFGDADFLLILKRNKPIGRLYVHRRPDEIRVIDLSILPEHRRQGIGTKLMADILKEARTADKPVRIHVAKFGRVLRFYERLGFVKIAEKEYAFLMECAPHARVIASPTSSDLYRGDGSA